MDNLDIYIIFLKYKVYLFYYKFLKWLYNMLETDYKKKSDESQWHSLDSVKLECNQDSSLLHDKYKDL